ncbi:diguanylate cyclase [Mangrovibacillus cuniculi]|uniref:Diguanylate cyclase n=1 Tax=Mangrovibacillus cuniculi TaxID=2593652 RepID=A0A7S8CAM5_9BACI|nr:diguanylate cyclase [Mangrovibacillus cuniculi]QPC46470.1 diguanylate cyclase [Mangrovibacillus cuniculi]
MERKKQIESLIIIDELTRAYNRKYLTEAFTRLHDRFISSNQPFCVGFVDLDYFKKTNDVYGHLVGDRVLKEFTTFVQSNLSSEDILFRYGGEEFILLFANQTIENVVNKLNAVKNSFFKLPFETDNGTHFQSFSAGVVEVQATNPHISYWLDLADLALYDAKENGRNRVQPYKDKFNPVALPTIHVSIIEGDPIMQSIIHSNLKESALKFQIELHVHRFETAESYLNSTLVTNKKNFIILSNFLSGISGVELVNYLKGLNILPLSLLITSNKNKDELREMIAAGATDYINKPLSFELLQKKMEFFIQHIIEGDNNG